MATSLLRQVETNTDPDMECGQGNIGKLGRTSHAQMFVMFCSLADFECMNKAWRPHRLLSKFGHPPKAPTSSVGWAQADRTPEQPPLLFDCAWSGFIVTTEILVICNTDTVLVSSSKI